MRSSLPPEIRIAALIRMLATTTASIMATVAAAQPAQPSGGPNVDDQPEGGDGERALKPELGEIEEQLHRWLAAVDDQRGSVTDELGGEHARAGAVMNRPRTSGTSLMEND